MRSYMDTISLNLTIKSLSGTNLKYITLKSSLCKNDNLFNIAPTLML